MNRNTIYAALRGHGTHIGWELPGGKVEPGETSRQAIIREIREELGALVEPKEIINVIEYDYDDFHLYMDVWLCTLVEGTVHSNEHSQERWLCESELDEVDWLPADRMALDAIRRVFRTGGE